MATSYANPGGTGDRTGIIGVTTTIALTGGTINNIVDGAKSTNNTTDAVMAQNTSQTLRNIVFDFGSGNKALITEAKWYQNGSSAHGTWKWQGSDDNASYADLSATFTLNGSSTGDVIGNLSANATSYRYYRLLQTAGTVNFIPWMREVEFKIDITSALVGAYGLQVLQETLAGGTSQASLLQVRLEVLHSMAAKAPDPVKQSPAITVAKSKVPLS